MRSIFRRYAELGSVRLLKEELEAQGIKSKSWTSAAGRLIGGKPFSRGALYLILQNRIYRGEIVHKGQSHPGEHPPIVDQPLWDAVQAQLAGNAAERNSGTRTHQPSLLAGMLFDGEGNRMTPSHAVKKGTRYRYYVSRPLITKDQTESSAAMRIPAAEIEQLVTSRVRQWLLDPGSIYQATGFPICQRSAGSSREPRKSGRAGPSCPEHAQRAFLIALIERIDVGANQIDIHFRPTRLGALLDVAGTPLPSASDDETQILSVPVRLRRSGREIRMLIDGTRPVCHSQTRCATDQAADQGAPLQCRTHRQRRRALCSTGQTGGREPVLFHAARPPQLSRPGHRASDSRRAPAAPI